MFAQMGALKMSESPMVGVITGVIIELFIVISYRSLQFRWRSLLLLIGPVVIAGALAIDYFVVTNKEALIATTKTIIQAAEDENAEAIIRLLDEDIEMSSDEIPGVQGVGIDRASLVIRGYLNGPFISNNIIRELSVKKVSDTHGSVYFSVSTTFDPKSKKAAGGYVRSDWQFDYIIDSSMETYKVSKMTNLRIRRGG